MNTSYNELIEWLEGYYKNQKRVRIYRAFEYSNEFAKDVGDAKRRGVEFSIDPMLPIDLLAIEVKKEIDDKTNRPRRVSYYTLLWVVSKDDTDLEKCLRFYQFYLSRISKLKGVQIIVVTPDKISKDLENSLCKTAGENGFGLWKVALSQKEPNVLCPPTDFRQRVVNSIHKPPKGAIPFGEPIKDEADNIALFCDGFVREAIEAMVGTKKVGRRYIERRVLDLVFELKNISYAQTLNEMVSKHLEQKGDDYDFVEEVFKKLWSAELNKDYSKFLRISEPSLYNIFPLSEEGKPYRDHYIHQFQVFLLGLHIIDKLCSSFSFDKNIEKQWLIAASFHDMAYPIEMFDDWARKFFFESLEIAELGLMDMKSHFVEKTILSCTGDIINLLCKQHFCRELRGNWLADEKELLNFFYEKITQVKHHCVISSIFLLKQASKGCNRELIRSLFVPPALAISIHHEKIWKELSETHGLTALDFRRDPLSFLLLFCDAAQEWGRPRDEPSVIANTELKKVFILEKITVTKSKCLVPIRAPYLLATDEAFKRKCGELESLQKFLKPPSDIKFQITLKDKSRAKREYSMIGH